MMTSVVISGRTVQYSSAFIAMLGMVCGGLHIGWSSPALPKLLEGTAGYTITRDDASWIASILLAGSTMGSLFARYLVDRVGRKTTMLTAAGPYIGGWLLIMFSTSGVYLYLAQLIAGWGIGIGLVVISMYCGEIAENSIRGALSSSLNFGMNIGSLISYSIGPYHSFKQVTYVSIVLPVLFFAAGLCIPESPYYFLMKGEKDKAKESLMKLRDSDKQQEVMKELDQIEKNVRDDMERRGGLKELFTNPLYRKAIIIIIGVRALQQLCGNMAIVSYMQIILESTKMDLPGSIGVIIYGVVQVFSGILAAILTDRLGRKPLLYASFVGLSLSLTAIGAYFFIQDYMEASSEVTSTISWIPLASIMVFCVSYSTGIGSLGYVMLGELFPTNIKGIAVGCGSIYGSLWSFTVSKAYLVVADAAGIYVAFWIFAACCYFGIIFTHFYIPETKNKSFPEIQAMLNPSSRHELTEKNSELNSVVTTH